MRLTILKVKGSSMHPTIASGAFVVVWQTQWLYDMKPISAQLFNYSPLQKHDNSANDGMKIMLLNQVIKQLSRLKNAHFSPVLLTTKLLMTASFLLKMGDIVAVKHPQYGHIIKRVAKIDYRVSHLLLNRLTSNYPTSKYLTSKHIIPKYVGRAKLVQLNSNAAQVKFESQIFKPLGIKAVCLCGDNLAESVTTAQMGWVHVSDILGKVVYVIDK